MGRFVSGVAVVTTRDRDGDRGATVSAVASVSDSPPAVLVCLNAESATCAAVRRNSSFVIGVLSSAQREVAMRFATKYDGKFAGLELTRSDAGDPILTGAHASLECRVARELEFATHVVVIATVERAVAGRNTSPLAYHRSNFGRVATTLASPGKDTDTDFGSAERDLW